ncbi:hypothetical protein CASFOL_023682 [Castilleja foliolosa]|uniref:Uncharacterized protein n=1 Tax=Castilleja foliolosa TaxID=1961234 RepID=A0ABD3CL77_9LAMI
MVDEYSWRKKKDGNTLKEAQIFPGVNHERLIVNEAIDLSKGKNGDQKVVSPVKMTFEIYVT